MLLEIDTLLDASEAPGKTKVKSFIFPLCYNLYMLNNKVILVVEAF